MILKRKYSTDSYTESLQANKRFKHSEGLQASSTELAFVKQAIEGCSGLKAKLSLSVGRLHCNKERITVAIDEFKRGG